MIKEVKIILAGRLGYGLVVWCIMQGIVLPLSQVPRGPLHLVNSLTGILILMVMIGLPLSFIARKYYFSLVFHKAKKGRALHRSRARPCTSCTLQDVVPVYQPYLNYL